MTNDYKKYKHPKFWIEKAMWEEAYYSSLIEGASKPSKGSELYEVLKFYDII